MLYQLSHFRPMHATTAMGGAESQIRTGDTAIFSRVLYQLSYLGPMANQVGRPSATAGYHGPRGLDGRGRRRTRTRPDRTRGRSAAGRVGRVERRLAGQLAQPVDPVEDRRVGREQPRRALLELLDRVREVQVLGRPVGDLEHLLVGGDLRQRPLEAVRVAGQLDRRRVGEVLALAADRQLDEPGAIGARIGSTIATTNMIAWSPPPPLSRSRRAAGRRPRT